MYEQMRNEMISRMAGVLEQEQIEQVIGILDGVAAGYTIEKQTTDLAVVGRAEAMDLENLYFIIRQQEGMSRNTISTESVIINRFIMSIGIPLTQVGPNHIRAYLYRYQQEHNVENRTLELYRCVICTWFKWLHTEGYIDTDPTGVIKKIAYQKKPRRALTQLQLEDVRYACKTKLEAALIEMLYSTGCRVSEITNVKMSDIDWSRKEITVTGKGNKIRTVYINAKAEKAYKAYL